MWKLYAGIGFFMAGLFMVVFSQGGNLIRIWGQ